MNDFHPKEPRIVAGASLLPSLHQHLAPIWLTLWSPEKAPASTVVLGKMRVLEKRYKELHAKWSSYTRQNPKGEATVSLTGPSARHWKSVGARGSPSSHSSDISGMRHRSADPFTPDSSSQRASPRSTALSRGATGSSLVLSLFSAWGSVGKMTGASSRLGGRAEHRPTGPVAVLTARPCPQPYEAVGGGGGIPRDRAFQVLPSSAPQSLEIWLSPQTGQKAGTGTAE